MSNEDDVAKKVQAREERMQKLREASQQLIIDSLRSCVSDYAIRTKQAEELTGILLAEKLTQDQFMSVLNQTIEQHVADKANERAVHQQQILQATSLAVNNLRNMLHDEAFDQNTLEGLRKVSNVISQGLATALGNMTDFDKPRNTPPTHQPE